MNKFDFGNKLIRFSGKITSNKIKYLEVLIKLNCLTTKYYNFFLGRIYFASNDGSQNMFVYQLTLDTLELKKDEGLVGSRKEDIILNLIHYTLLSCKT